MCKPIIAFSLVNQPVARKLEDTSHEEMAALRTQGDPLLTEEDIVAYSSEFEWSPFHQMRLSPEGAARLSRYSSDLGTPFMVTVHGEPIYLGVLMTADSPWPNNLPTILIDERAKQNESRWYFIDRNHPHRSDLGQDPRRDSRLVQALQQLGKVIHPQ